MGLTSAKAPAPTIRLTDTSLSENSDRVRSPTHQRAIKEESKAANRDWVDHLARSLLQHINGIANPLKMGNYPTNCTEKLWEPTIFLNPHTKPP